MKKLITILLTLLTLTSFSQERHYELERLILDKVNEFRISQGLLAVEWNDKVYDAAYHHAYYLSLDSVPFSHEENYDVDGFEEISDAQHRIKHYYDKYSWGIECLTGMNIIWFNGDLEKAATWVVNGWINSPGHRRGMLFDTEGAGNLEFGAVSVLMKPSKYSWENCNVCWSAWPTLVMVHTVK